MPPQQRYPFQAQQQNNPQLRFQPQQDPRIPAWTRSPTNGNQGQTQQRFAPNGNRDSGNGGNNSDGSRFKRSYATQMSNEEHQEQHYISDPQSLDNYQEETPGNLVADNYVTELENELAELNTKLHRLDSSTTNSRTNAVLLSKSGARSTPKPKGDHLRTE